jgi:molybdenum cofactor cytidylyltransferase
MGKSIKTGLQHLLNLRPDLSQVILMVCDQPYLGTNQLISLRSVSLATEKPIVASYYNHSPGVPALFTRRLFPQLLALEDSHGAKKVIQQNLQEAELLPFPEGDIDLDTLEDYLNFLNR